MSSENITEQPSAGINVVPDGDAEAHADKLQKQQDLKKLEDEIKMLRQVLNDKVKQARTMRVELGQATIGDNIENVSKNLEEKINIVAEDISQTEAYKKTSDALVNVGQVTAETATLVGSAIGAKFSAMQQSDSYNKLSQNLSQVGTNLMDSVSSIGKPKQMQEFNEGNN